MNTPAPPTGPEAVVVTITVPTATGDHDITVTLNDTPAARSLLDQLPLRLQFRDFNHVEKLALLPRPLTMKGMPSGDDPEPGDVGFYAPTGALVLYYHAVGYWPGIARIGRLPHQDIEFLASLEEKFTAVLTQVH